MKIEVKIDKRSEAYQIGYIDGLDRAAEIILEK